MPYRIYISPLAPLSPLVFPCRAFPPYCKNMAAQMLVLPGLLTSNRKLSSVSQQQQKLQTGETSAVERYPPSQMFLLSGQESADPRQPKCSYWCFYTSMPFCRTFYTLQSGLRSSLHAL